LRNLLKYNYWRTEPSHRDWIQEPDFSFRTANYALKGAPTFRQQFQDGYDAARMFFWLCGRADEFKLMGGQGWPIPANYLDFQEGPYGFPNTPTWR
jgi:hypothetical protein